MSVLFSNNPNLPNINYVHMFTAEERQEFIKCSEDPVYFATTYMRIVNVDRGLIPFDMWDFQKDMLLNFHENRFNICKLPRQVGKSTTAIAFLLHYIIFNQHVNVAILANKSATARELLGRLQLAYEYLPMFLKMGVVVWNKGYIELANGSKARADSTSGSSVRGQSFSVIFLDEFAFVPNHIAEAFFSSTYPTITSGVSTKVIIVSTPNGLNLFYKMWMDSIEKRSHYISTEIHWSMVPGRTQEWKEETIRNTSEEQFRQEFECEFLGSTNTLIHPAKLRVLLASCKEPIRHEDSVDIWEEPQKDRVYTICVDVAEGQGLDYSTFSIFDVTQIPYVQVAKYRNNKIIPYVYPTVILTWARKYNDAFVLVEINSIGLQVADTLHFELGYENLIKFMLKGRQGQFASPGFKPRVAFGIKTSVQTKKIGCANLKALIENDKLILNDQQTCFELTTFSQDKNSFAAEEGNNDDLVMTLVHFGWLTAQRYFKENIKNDIRQVLQQEILNVMDQDIVPFGIIDNGIDDPFDDSEQEKRELRKEWIRNQGKLYPFDDFNFQDKLRGI